MKQLLLLPILCLAPLAHAHVREDAHEKCLKAADYAGCVQVNSSVAEVDGNACPPGYAYAGDNACKEVECRYTNLHSPLLAGRMWKCEKWGLTIMRLQPGVRSEMVNDPACPAGKPEVGWNSTCDSPYIEPPKEDRIPGRRA